MKIRIVFFMCIISANYIQLHGSLSGPITTQTVTPGSVEYGNAFWFSASAPYANGGVTFTFPTNLFLQTPVVVASVSSSSYSSLNTVSCIITSVSATSVTVRVNLGTLLTIGEAASNSVTVHVWAVGTAN